MVLQGCYQRLSRHLIKEKNGYTTADGGFCYQRQRVNRHLIKEKWKKPDVDPRECR